jgi:ElaB/YqjD/DUF883 family membrane-anchored ribosome-binding protein
MGEMKRTTEEIQAEIARVRETLQRDVSALEVTVREKLDWRRPVRERPLVWVGGALAVGFVLGVL